MYVHATRSRAREHRALDGPSAQRCVRVNGAAKHVPHPRMLRARASRLAGCPRSAGHASGCALLLSVTQCTSWQHHLPHNRFVQCAASVCSAQSAVRVACLLPAALLSSDLHGVSPEAVAVCGKNSLFYRHRSAGRGTKHKCPGWRDAGGRACATMPQDAKTNCRRDSVQEAARVGTAPTTGAQCESWFHDRTSAVLKVS